MVLTPLECLLVTPHARLGVRLGLNAWMCLVAPRMPALALHDCTRSQGSCTSRNVNLRPHLLPLHMSMLSPPAPVLAARAQLVGEQTFGKGVVQYYFPVNNDGGVKLTVAKYLTPHRCEPLARTRCAMECTAKLPMLNYACTHGLSDTDADALAP